MFIPWLSLSQHHQIIVSFGATKMIQPHQAQQPNHLPLMSVHCHHGTHLNRRATADHLIPILMTLSSQVVAATLEEVVQVVTGKDESFCRV